MQRINILDGTIHPVSERLAQALLEHEAALKTWNDITPLARNEWICLATSAKQEATTARRQERILSQLSKGQRRPCCWEGCPHREKV